MKFITAPFFLTAALALATRIFAGTSDEELVRQLANPVAPLLSVGVQSNFDFRMGPLDQGTRATVNLQPIIPIALNQDWNLIVRTNLPYVSQEDVFKGASALGKFPGLPGIDPRRGYPVLANRLVLLGNGLSEKRLVLIGFETGAERIAAARRAFEKATRRQPVDHHQDGLGDLAQSFFFSPKEPVGGWSLGFGPALLFSTATDDRLGAQKWAAGPTAVALRQSGGWTWGVLANHLWSYAGYADRRSVNATFVQPFVSYATRTRTTFGLDAEAGYDWNESQWTVPVNLSVSQFVRLGGVPLQLVAGGRYSAEGPSGAPEWGLRFGCTLLFPR